VSPDVVMSISFFGVFVEHGARVRADSPWIQHQLGGDPPPPLALRKATVVGPLRLEIPLALRRGVLVIRHRADV